MESLRLVQQYYQETTPTSPEVRRDSTGTAFCMVNLLAGEAPTSVRAIIWLE